MSFIIDGILYFFPCVIWMGWILPLVQAGAGLVGGWLGRRRERKERRRAEQRAEEMRQRARQALAGAPVMPELEAGIGAQLRGELPVGMGAQLQRIAGEQQARLAKMGILTGGRTLPEVLQAQTEQMILPAYQRAQEQAMELKRQELARRQALAGIETGGA